MKLFSTLSIVFLSIVAFNACNKNKPIPITPPAVYPDSTVDVYIAGNYGDTLRFSYPSPPASTAMYWKNGISVALSDGIHEAKALSIAVSGNDVYVAGYEVLNGTNRIATYWKNGTAVSLTDNSRNAWANSIAVSGNDVYVCGYEKIGQSLFVSKYWKNGVEIMLSGSGGSSQATEIHLDGSDVYICGNEWNTGQGSTIAALWKNGNHILLNDSINSGCSSIAINGSNLYVAGNKHFFDANNNWVNYAQYWHNGVAELMDTTRFEKANKIVVADNDVYMGGCSHQLVNTDTNQVAKYWKNGISFLLPSATARSEVYGIAKLNSNLYIVGYDGNYGAVWINGNLFTTMDEYTCLTDIKVVPK